jgi:hypothetical protein
MNWPLVSHSHFERHTQTIPGLIALKLYLKSHFIIFFCKCANRNSVVVFANKLVFFSCFVPGLSPNMPSFLIQAPPRHSSVHRFLSPTVYLLAWGSSDATRSAAVMSPLSECTAGMRCVVEAWCEHRTWACLIELLKRCMHQQEGC